MKAIVLTCYESNEEPAALASLSLKNMGFEVKTLTTNYSHIRKSFRTSYPDDFWPIETLPYKKNLSVERLKSHARFAKDAFDTIEKYNPDLIYIFAPAHSLIKQANIYKTKHPDVKIIIHIIDMWPESLPIGNIKKTLPFKKWRDIRTNNINAADFVVTECDLYQDILKKEYHGEMKTIHWSRDTVAEKYQLDLPEDKLALAYIGSINNIIDIDEIKRLVCSADKPVILHIIGSGENKEEMLKKLESVCELIYHGPIYDVEEKKNIFSMCHAGLNIYKDNLYIGLTVKSIDYFNYGLPVINNIKGDTAKLVDEYKVGINVNHGSTLKYAELLKMRLDNQNIIDLYNSEFTSSVFIKKCENVIDKVMNK